MNVVEIEGLKKSFEIPGVRPRTVRDSFFGALKRGKVEQLKVLDGASLVVKRGETLGVMGKNGSGKSTLLKLIAGIYEPDGGSVRVHVPLTPVLELGVGWNGELDAVDNIILTSTIMGLRLAEARTAVDEILAFAELERFANLELKHYSSGMAARLAYATAFRAARELLILDEIFAVGDAGFRAKCEERYQQLKRDGHTLILVSHSDAQVTKLCERAVLLDKGKVAAEGTGKDVAAAYLELNKAAPLAP